MLNSGRRERQQPRRYHEEGEVTRAEHPVSARVGPYASKALKEFVNTESEGDQGSGSPDPGHQRPFIG